MTNRPSGQIITFYSYKGGTGRTMALANLACLLVRPDSAHRQGVPPRVLAIDWDFEAPGLHRYLQPYLEPESAKRFPEAPGCLELFENLGTGRSAYNHKDFVGNRQRARTRLRALDLEHYLLATRFPGLSLIKAGIFDDDYPRRVSEFDWDDLFHTTVGLFAGVADFLRAQFEYVLVDSRTGITDTSGICTMLLPDKLVVVFTPNQQSLTGIESLVRKAVAYRKGSPDGRPLTVFPLPSRVEMARPQLLEAWRNGSGTDPSTAALLPEEMSGYQPTFERLFVEIYARPDISLGDYFNEVMLQHIPDYAYGEPVAVALETSDARISLSRSYMAFRDRLIELDVPWNSLQAARLERDIVQRCEAIADKLSEGAVEEGIKLAFALIEHKPPGSLFERSANAVLDVARAAYPRNSAAASTLIRQVGQQALALGQSDVDPSTLGQVLLEAGKVSQDFGDLPLATELLTASRSRFSACFGAEHPATLMVMNQIASVLEARGDFAHARDIYQEVLEVRRRVLGEEHPDTIESINNLARLLQDQGDFAAARPLFERALAIREKALGPEHIDTAVSLDNLANLLYAQGDLATPRPLFERALAIREKALRPDHPDTAVSLDNLATLLYIRGDLAAARPLFERALAIREKALGPDHPSTAASLSNLATLLQAQGDLAVARPLFERALAIVENAFGPDHPSIAASLSNLAILLQAQGDLAAARRLFERALAILKNVFGPDHLWTAASLSNLATLLQAQGDLAAARPLFEHALAILLTALGPDHPRTATGLNNLARLLQDQGDLAAARALSERALATREKALGPDHPDTAQSLNNLASLLRAQGDLTGARALQEKALELSRRLLGEEHPDTLTALNNLAVVARAEGHLDEARAMGERVLHLRSRVLGSTHPSTVESMRDLGETLKQLGDTKGALDLLTRAFDIQAKGQSRSERQLN
jgi:tetratricopeptide (TPR) repeat protein/MinD-like ATPase involved in chromosome partitioning or flagellar assembly